MSAVYLFLTLNLVKNEMTSFSSPLHLSSRRCIIVRGGKGHNVHCHPTMPAPYV